jgi:tetratricopeptide (TPR) repeat protein
LVTVHLQGLAETGWTGQARLLSRFDETMDDVVLLEVVGDQPPLGSSQVAMLGRSQLGERHRFLSYGFPERGKYVGWRTDGVIHGAVPRPEDVTLQAEPVQLRSDEPIEPGMSGAAVLDEELNLVVGIVAETWERGGRTGGPGTAWAVDAQVMRLQPFRLPVLEAAIPRKPLAAPQVDIEAARQAAVDNPGWKENDPSAGVVKQGLVSRPELLEAITLDNADRRRRMVGLIGFGGEGKTTLARTWVEALRGVAQSLFWWSFSRPDVDGFFEALHSYMTEGRVDLGPRPSTTERMNLACAMLSAHRYLLVLDGIELLQRQDADRYGVLANAGLRTFLRYFAATRHDSFCLLTSRVPLADMVDVPTDAYVERHVGRLTKQQGRELLRRRGVLGADADLDMVVEQWDGHALTLTLLGGLLAKRGGGDIARVDELPTPGAGEEPYERVGRLLDYYDQQLTAEERAFLKIFSAFRTPVDRRWFAEVFQANNAPDSIAAPLASMSDAQFERMLSRLVDLSIIRRSAEERTYSLQPLVRDHYSARLQATDQTSRRRLHDRIKQRYLLEAPEVHERSTIGELATLVEAVHHACRAGQYEEALRLYQDRLEQGGDMHLSYRLNAYDTVSQLMDGFFPHQASAGAPLLPTGRDRRYVINRKGVAMMNTGHLEEASALFDQAVEEGRRSGDILGATQSSENKAEVSIYRGRIQDAEAAAERALQLADGLDEGEREEEVRDCLTYRGWAASLAGRDDVAAASFDQAEQMQQRLEPEQPFLTDIWGIAQAHFLRRHGETERAQRLAEANLHFSQEEGLEDDISICHRLLGDLAADAGNRDEARSHYDKAVDKARTIPERTVLLEALTARGRWTARRGDVREAREDLEEGLQHAQSSGYRLLEVDTHVAYAWIHARTGAFDDAETEVALVEQKCAELGYDWGRWDVEEVKRFIREQR